MMHVFQGTFPEMHNTCDDGYAGTAPVDAYAPRGYGLNIRAGDVGVVQRLDLAGLSAEPPLRSRPGREGRRPPDDARRAGTGPRLRSSRRLHRRGRGRQGVVARPEQGNDMTDVHQNGAELKNTGYEIFIGILSIL